MGNKINPTGLRLGITQEHRSKWFATAKTYPALLQEDFKIRNFIQKKYSSAGISDILIARKADQLELELKTARPGVIEEGREAVSKSYDQVSKKPLETEQDKLELMLLKWRGLMLTHIYLLNILHNN